MNKASSMTKNADRVITTMNAQEAADFLRTTKAGLYAMVARRQIPFSRLTKRKLLFIKEDLSQLVEDRKVEPSRYVSPNGNINIGAGNQ